MLKLAEKELKKSMEYQQPSFNKLMHSKSKPSLNVNSGASGMFGGGLKGGSFFD